MINEFVSTMSDEEKSRIMQEARIVEAQGDIEEARRIRNKIPVNPVLANEMKMVVGVGMLRKIGCNFADVIKMYGEEWFYE